MPGAKRKYDEDTWIVSQSKKFKCGQLISNVYATTLAQLRLGARKFFSQHPEIKTSQSQSASPSSDPASPEVMRSPPPSPVLFDVISQDDSSPCPAHVPHPRELCQNCLNKKDGWENCYYCEKLICHSNPCNRCQYGFCVNCCIAKYDNPVGEAFVCYSCLH